MNRIEILQQNMANVKNMSRVEQLDQQINSLFASNDVTVDGPGEEAFWNGVEEVELINPTAASELEILATQWLIANGC